MGFANRSALVQEIRAWSGRSDSRFTARIPKFISGAEHRIYYGSTETVPTDAVRTRQMEIAESLTPTASSSARVLSATLPARYLSMRRVYLQGDVTRQFTYLSPQVFWTDSRVSPGGTSSGWLGRPRAYTIEGGQIHIAPIGDGTIEMLFYQRFAPLVADGDTNALLQETDLFFHAAMGEAWAFSRNAVEEQKALQRYAGLASGLNTTEQKGRRSGAPLAPQTVPRGMSDRAV